MTAALPPRWAVSHLADVAELALGKMLDRAKRTAGRPLPYLRNINVRWGRFELSDLLQMPFEENELERHELRKGDVLICEGGEPGRAAVWPGSADLILFQKALHRVRCSRALEPQWLVYQLKHDAERGLLSQHFTGTTIKHFTGSALREYPVALPPLNEQRRIVAKLDDLLARSRRAKEALDAIPALLEQFRQSVLAAAFRGDLTRDWRKLRSLPAWGKQPLGQVAEVIDPNPSHRYPTYEGGTVPLLSTREFNGLGSWSVEGAPLVPESVFEAQLRTCRFSPTDVIIARKGRLGLARRPPPLPRYAFSHTIFVLKPRPGLDHNFLLWFMRQETTVSWLEMEMNSNTGVPTLGKAVTERLPLPLPSVDEQVEIARRVERIFAGLEPLEHRLKRASERLRQLESASLARAFSGHLVPEDPEDEPASALLERIRAERGRLDHAAPSPLHTRRRETKVA